jgi:hypothetical protein
VFNGAPVSEDITISANGEGATLLRPQGNITMDLHSVERIEVAPLAGADNITVNNLAGTSVKEVAIDLAAPGTTAGDGQTDTVNVNGTAGTDHITVKAPNGVVTVAGLSAEVTIAHGEAADILSLNGGAGNDVIDASASPAGTMAFIFRGGDGNDNLVGGGGNDIFAFTAGETGHDLVQDFQVHGASVQGDTVLLKGFADATFDQAVAAGHIAQFGADVHILDGANLVATLENVSLASLHAQDFLFV